MKTCSEGTFIYCLKCPTTGDVRYIGQTNNLNIRFRKHLTDSSKGQNYLGNWLRSLKGNKPVLAILHEVAEHESWAEEERRYISCARAMGIKLVNATDGGEGAPGHKQTPEHRAAIGAAQKGVPKGPRSPEHCAAISAAKKGVPLSPAQRAANEAKKGVPLSPETRAAMSAVRKGVPKSPETRAALSAAKKGVPHSPEHRAAMSAARKGVPWTPAQRAAYEAGKLATQT